MSPPLSGAIIGGSADIPSDQSCVLLVEDDQDDVLLFRRALGAGTLAVRLTVVGDGESAIKYLSGEGEYSDRERYPLPTLIVTDLKMPRCNGFELIAWLREHPSFDGIRIVVLSSSDDTNDQARAMQLGAAGYLVKTVDRTGRVALVHSLEACLAVSAATSSCDPN